MKAVLEEVGIVMVLYKLDNLQLFRYTELELPYPVRITMVMATYI